MLEDTPTSAPSAEALECVLVALDAHGLLRPKAFGASQVAHMFDLFRLATACVPSTRVCEPECSGLKALGPRLFDVLSETLLRGQAGGEIPLDRSADELADAAMAEFKRHLDECRRTDPGESLLSTLLRLESQIV